MDDRLKLCHTIDALFGAGVSRHVPRALEFAHSRKNGRIRTVSHGGQLLCTLRTDGGIALTPRFAQMLLKSRRFADSCVTVSDEAAPFVAEGRSVFCKHVVSCGRRVLAGADVPVLHEGRVIAVGRAVVPAALIGSLGAGVAVRVRNSLKRRAREDDAK